MSIIARLMGRSAAAAPSAAMPAVRSEPALRSPRAMSGAVDDPATAYMFGSRGWGGGSRVRSLPPATPTTAQRHATVFACCNIIAGDSAKLPLKIMQTDRKGKTVEVREHPASYLLNVEASPGVPAMVARFTLGYSFALRGQAYGFCPRDGGGELMMLEALTADQVSVIKVGRDRLYSFTDAGDVARVAVPSRIMANLRYMAEDGWTGRSPIQVAEETVGLALAGQEAAARNASGAVLRGYIKLDDYFEDDEAQRRSQRAVRDALNDPEANGIPIISQGEVKSLEMSAADRELIDQRKLDREQLASMWRMPPFKLGILDNGVKANGEQQAIDYRSDCLSHWCGFIEAQLGQTVLTEAERRAGMYLIHDYEELLTPTTREKYAALREAVGGPFMLWSEARARADLPELTDGEAPYPPPNMTDKSSGAPAPTNGGQ